VLCRSGPVVLPALLWQEAPLPSSSPLPQVELLPAGLRTGLPADLLPAQVPQAPLPPPSQVELLPAHVLPADLLRRLSADRDLASRLQFDPMYERPPLPTAGRLYFCMSLA
jgi:hypothetical protein